MNDPSNAAEAKKHCHVCGGVGGTMQDICTTCHGTGRVVVTETTAPTPQPEQRGDEIDSIVKDIQTELHDKEVHIADVMIGVRRLAALARQSVTLAETLQFVKRSIGSVAADGANASKLCYYIDEQLHKISQAAASTVVDGTFVAFAALRPDVAKLIVSSKGTTDAK